MLTTEDLIGAFGRNVHTIELQCKGLTHADALLQPPFRGNCMNWVLGHIADNRNRILVLLGQPPLMTEAESARYGHGSQPVLGEGEGVLSLSRLLDVIQRAQSGIETGLRNATAEQLTKPMSSHMGTISTEQLVFFLYYHDTYHTGQTELLRQLAGTNDHVI